MLNKILNLRLSEELDSQIVAMATKLGASKQELIRVCIGLGLQVLRGNHVKKE